MGVNILGVDILGVDILRLTQFTLVRKAIHNTLWLLSVAKDAIF